MSTNHMLQNWLRGQGRTGTDRRRTEKVTYRALGSRRSQKFLLCEIVNESNRFKKEKYYEQIVNVILSVMMIIKICPWISPGPPMWGEGQK